MKRKLTPKQARFVQEYLIDLNATAAAGRAGYSDPNFGRQLITKPNVSMAIEKAQEKRSKKTEITQEWVLTNLKAIAERCSQAVPVLDREGQPTGEYRFDSSGANKALELLGKHLKMFVERVEATVLSADVEIIMVDDDRENSN